MLDRGGGCFDICLLGGFMAWNWSDAGIGAGLGGIGGAVIGGSGILGKKKTISEPSEITNMRKLLAQFGSTGQFGDFKAGADVGLGYGDFNMTPIEHQGQSQLQSLLSSGIPDQYRMGDQALQDLLQTSPEAIDKQFQPFKTQTERTIGEQQQALKRASAFGGNLYSTKTIKQLGDIGARGNETLTSKLAELTDAYQQRKLSAIPLAYQSGSNQENILQNRIAASQQYGGLSRQLNDASINARDAEILRRRQELQLPIQAAGSVMGASWTPPVSSSPYSDLLKLLGTIGGAYLGGPAGAAVGSQAGSMVGKYAGGNNASAGYSA